MLRWRDKDKPAMAKGLYSISMVGGVLALLDAFGQDVYLAATQWAVVSVVFGVWAVYHLVEAGFRIDK